MKIVQIFGDGIAGQSSFVTAQRRLNCYMEARNDGDKAQVFVLGTPGLSLQFTLSAGVPRGLFGAQGNLFTVILGSFYQVSSTGAVLYSATVNSFMGNVSFDASATQLLVVDGVNGYSYSAYALTQIVSAGFPNGAKTVTFVGSFFVCEQPGSQKFWVSDAFDGATWNALAFASASQYPGLLLAVDSLGGHLVLFSEDHLEFWQNVGATPQPFAPILSATAEYGIAAIFSRAHSGGSMFFVSINREGAYQICQIQGYNVAPISTPDLDFILAGFSTVADATALSFSINGHPIYQVTFPIGGRTFFYDVLTGLWSERQSGVDGRYRGMFATLFGGRVYMSDYANGNVYQQLGTTFTDNGDIIVREIITRHAQSDGNVFTIDELFLDMETGVGNTGQGLNPTVMLNMSKDNGRTYGTERWFSSGAIGVYLARVIARQWGSARNFVLKIRMTDPVRFVIAYGALVVRQKNQ